MIKFENVYIKYSKRFFSLANINFELPDHKNAVIVSDDVNCGTALLRMIAKIEKSYKGQIYIDNTELKKMNIKHMNICYLPIQPTFIKNKSVIFNLTYPLIIRKIPHKNAYQMVENILKKYNLSQYQNTKIRFLPNNVLYKIFFLRCLARPIDILLIDNIFENIEEQDLLFYINCIKNIKTKNTIINCNKKIAELFNYHILKIENSLLSK